jgi:hypothetical protein
MPGLKPEKKVTLHPPEKAADETTDKSSDKAVARDLVKLKHVETHIQKPTSLSETLKQKVKQESETKEKLSDDAFAAISAISDSKRLFLQRILIVLNQSRVPLGKPPLKEAEVRELMNELVKKDIVKMVSVTTEGLAPREVYSLTDKGKELLE